MCPSQLSATAVELGLLGAQGATAREWLVGAGRPLSAAAFAPLLRRPGLELGRLTAGARRGGGAFLGDASRWPWAVGRASGAPDPSDDAAGALRGGGAPAGAESGAAAPAERATDARPGPGARAAAVEGGRFDMDAPPLRPQFRVECPLDFPRPGLAEVAAGAAKPYLFGGQRPGCTNCNDPHKARPGRPRGAARPRPPRLPPVKPRRRRLYCAAPRCPRSPTPSACAALERAQSQSVSRSGAVRARGTLRPCAALSRRRAARAAPRQGRWCAYDSELSHTGAPICPAAEQATLLAHFAGRAGAGDAWAANMLRMTPCDLWPFLRGRTLWLLGDSITQEAMRASECFLQEFWGMAPPWSKPTANDSAVAVMMTRSGMEPWCMELIEGTRVCHIRRRARPPRPRPRTLAQTLRGPLTPAGAHRTG